MLAGSLVLAVNYAGPGGLTFPVLVCDPCPLVDVGGEKLMEKLKIERKRGAKFGVPARWHQIGRKHAHVKVFLKFTDRKI